MAAITFVQEPSLQQKNSRLRALLASDVKAHASKHVHSTRGIYHVPVRKKQREILLARASSKVARLPVRVPADPSTYVQRTYADYDAVHINNLCEYFVHLAGPMYVWNVCDSDYERQQFQKKMITWTLTQPLVSEGVLAWLQCLWDRKSGNSNASSARMLTHQSRSLAAIREALDHPETIDPWVMMWAIVAQLVLNQECEDWASFKVNLAGLNSIIARLGGIKTMQHIDIRAYVFVTGLQTVLAHRDTRASAQPPSHTAQLSPQSDYFTEATVPAVFIKLLETGDLNPSTADELCNAIFWLRWYDRSNDNTRPDTSEGKALSDRKAHIEFALETLMESQTISNAGFALCLGALVKVATTRFPTDMWRKLCQGSRVPSWFGQLKFIAGNSLSHEMRLSVLWAAISVMEMPVNISPGFGMRLAFLKWVMSTFPAHVIWDDVCGALSEIHLRKELSPFVLDSWKERASHVPLQEDKRSHHK